MSEVCFGYYPRFPTLPDTQPLSTQPLTRVTTTSDIGRYLAFGDRFVVLHEQQLHEVGGRDAVGASSEAHVRMLLSENELQPPMAQRPVEA